MPCPKCFRDFSEEPWFIPAVIITVILLGVFFIKMTMVFMQGVGD